jgi:hypothetical protein
MPATFCSCCDRRAALAVCDCGPWYCNRCLLCVGHCHCRTPGIWLDMANELSDDTVEGQPDVIVIPRE